MRLLYAAGMGLLLAGCVNPYAKFYQSEIGNRSATQMPYYLPCDGEPQIFISADVPRDLQELERQGFIPVGFSSFNGSSKDLTQANVLDQANAVSACRVLIVSSHTGTQTGAIPLNLPNNSTSYTTGTASAYGNGGYANAYGSSTTSTYGTQTVIMPYRVERFDAGAVYFVKSRNITGTLPGPVPPELSKELGQNGGVYVKIVVVGGPAYKADIMEDDVFWAFNGQRVDPQNGLAVLLPMQGQTVNVDIYRGTTLLHKSITLNTLPQPIVAPDH